MALKRALQNIFGTRKVGGAILYISPPLLKVGGSAKPPPLLLCRPWNVALFWSITGLYTWSRSIYWPAAAVVVAVVVVVVVHLGTSSWWSSLQGHPQVRQTARSRCVSRGRTGGQCLAGRTAAWYWWNQWQWWRIDRHAWTQAETTYRPAVARPHKTSWTFYKHTQADTQLIRLLDTILTNSLASDAFFRDQIAPKSVFGWGCALEPAGSLRRSKTPSRLGGDTPPRPKTSPPSAPSAPRSPNIQSWIHPWSP